MLVLRRLFCNWEESDMVEWKKLGDVCNFQNGYAFKSGLFKDIGLPIIRITNISDRSVNLDDCKYFNFEDYKGVNLDDFIIRKGDILVAMSGATTGKIGFYNHSNISYLNQRVGKFIPHEEMLENRYLYHFLLSQYKVIYIMAGGGAQPNLSSNKLLNDLFIPIPSKSEQERIVSILDTFTSSISNLKEQIKERRKQYEYYRDQLLDLEGKDGVEMKTLEDVAVIMNGRDYKHLSEGDIPVYGTGGIMTYVDTYAYDMPSVLLPRKGSVEKIYYVTTPFWTVDTIYWTKINSEVILPKYLYHALCMYDLKDFSYGGGIPSLSQKILYKLEIPLPSKEEQLRIVSILDQFEASIANLEAQLKEREKQYEYYRNQLLTFE